MFFIFVPMSKYVVTGSFVGSSAVDATGLMVYKNPNDSNKLLTLYNLMGAAIFDIPSSSNQYRGTFTNLNWPTGFVLNRRKLNVNSSGFYIAGAKYSWTDGSKLFGTLNSNQVGITRCNKATASYFYSKSSGGSIIRWDAADMSNFRANSMGGTPSYWVVDSSDTTYALITGGSSILSYITAADFTAGGTVGSVPTGYISGTSGISNIYDMVIDGSYIYAATNDASNNFYIKRINTASKAVDATWATTRRFTRIETTANFILGYDNLSGNIQKYNKSTGAYISEFNPGVIDINYFWEFDQENRFFVLKSDLSQIYAVDIATMSLVGTVSVPTGATDMAVSDDGAVAYVVGNEVSPGTGKWLLTVAI